MSDEMKAFLEGVVGVVEANSYESMCLWQEHTKRHGKESWVSNLSGFLEIVGHLNDKPVCISLFTTVVNGQKLLFWHATSTVVDHDIIRKWFEKNLTPEAYGNTTDAMNFHNVLRR